jgi:HSP20 family molecular chaperone IbpA
MNCNTNCGCSPAAEPQTAQAPATFRPDIDIRETPDEFVVLADVPGATPESIDLAVEKGVLTMKARVGPREPSGATRVVREYGVGGYERSFRVGDGVDTDTIAAEVKDGVLTLRLPKAQTTRARKIKVVG